MSETEGEAENLPQDTETEVRAFILTCEITNEILDSF